VEFHSEVYPEVQKECFPSALYYFPAVHAFLLTLTANQNPKGYFWELELPEIRYQDVRLIGAFTDFEN
jgi:hypothetical protein